MRSRAPLGALTLMAALAMPGAACTSEQEDLSGTSQAHDHPAVSGDLGAEDHGVHADGGGSGAADDAHGGHGTLWDGGPGKGDGIVYPFAAGSGGEASVPAGSLKAFTCATTKAGLLSVGKPCAKGDECAAPGTNLCLHGLTALDGFCTRECRTDRECSDMDLTGPTEVIPENLCVRVRDGLSACVPSTCLSEIQGWDSYCTESGKPVNDEGVGQACNEAKDCAGQAADQCPPAQAAQRFCFLPCERDAECGSNAACVCVEAATFAPPDWRFICTPYDGCGDAIRHHHCRGTDVLPRGHEHLLPPSP